MNFANFIFFVHFFLSLIESTSFDGFADCERVSRSMKFDDDLDGMKIRTFVILPTDMSIQFCGRSLSLSIFSISLLMLLLYYCKFTFIRFGLLL